MYPRGRDYGYANARIRGMRGRLLPAAFFEELAATRDLIAVIRRLEDTPYSADLARHLLHGRTASAVDAALRDNMTRTYRQVRMFANDEARRLLGAVFGYWDVFNVKTILRGKHVGLPPEEVTLGLVPAGQLGQPELEELGRQPGVQGVIETLYQWNVALAEPIRRMMPKYGEARDLMSLEAALDRGYYAWASDQLRGHGHNARVARRFLGAHVDAINILTCLRLVHDDIGRTGAERYFMPGGRIVGLASYLKLASAGSVDEVVGVIEHTEYGKAFQDVMARYARVESLPVLERALESVVFRAAYESQRGDALGIGVAISYLWTKANEVTNLRIVVKGVGIGMPRDTVREALIGV